MKFNSSRSMIASFVTILLITSALAPILVHPVAAAPFDPWATGWTYRRQITIDSGKVSGTLTNFPVLVDITLDKTKVQSTGNDILFMDGTGSANKLNHEIELYDSGTGHLIAWVQIPTLSSSTGRTFYVYYGNTGASNQQNPTGVWDSPFKMVQHMNDGSDTSHIKDSTSYANDGVKVAGGTGAQPNQVSNGIIGNAQNFIRVSTTGGGYITVANPSGNLNFGTGSFSYMFWFKRSSSAASTENFLSKKQGSMSNDYPGYVGGISSSSYFSATVCNSTGTPGGATYYVRVNTAANSAQTTDWKMFTVVVDTSQHLMYVYLDTTMSGPSARFVGSVDTSQILRLGGASDGTTNTGAYYNGILDEVRIQSGALSIDWITTSYNSMNSPATFYTLGSEEQTSTVAVSLNAISPQFYKRGSTVPYSGTVTIGGSPAPDGTDVGIVVKDRLNAQTFTDTVKTAGGAGAFSSNFVIGSSGVEGLWTIYASSGDGKDQKTFYLDVSTPSSAKTSPSGWVSSVSTITGSASDPNLADGNPGSGVKYAVITIQRSTDSAYWTGGAWGSQTWLNTTLGSGTWTYTPSGISWTAGATYTVVTQAKDNAGNIETPGAGSTFSYENAAPTSAATSPTGWVSTVPTISGTDSDTGGSGVKYVVITLRRSTDSQYWTGSTWGSLTWLNTTLGAGTWTYTPSGVTWTSGATYTVAPQAKDNAGNQAAGTSGTFSYDNAAPTSSVSSPSGWVSSVSTISGSAADTGGAGVASVTITLQRSVDNLYWTGSTWGASTPLATVYAAGTWTFTASSVTWTSGRTYTVVPTATDTLGNSAAGTSGTFSYDNTAPTSAVTNPVDGSYVSSVTTISGTASDGSGSGVASVAITIKRSSDNLYWTGSTWGSLTWLPTTYSAGSWSYGASGVSWTSGEYSVVSKATDAVGNVETPGAGIHFDFGTGEVPTVTVIGAYHGARLSWTSVSALSYNIYYNTVNNPDTATQFTTGVTALTYDVKNLPSSTWGATCYFWIAPVTSGGETPKTSWGLGQTVPPDKIWAYKVEVSTVTVATAQPTNIRVDVQFRSRYLETTGVTVTLQIGEYLGPDVSGVVPNRPITISTTGPTTLTSLLSAGSFSFETVSNSEIQSGRSYKAWIFLWNQLPSAPGFWEPYADKSEKIPILIP